MFVAARQSAAQVYHLDPRLISCIITVNVEQRGDFAEVGDLDEAAAHGETLGLKLTANRMPIAKNMREVKSKIS